MPELTPGMHRKAHSAHVYSAKAKTGKISVAVRFH